MKTRCDPSEPLSESAADERIEAAVAVLRRGGVVVFPTTALYGLGADALNRDAVRRVFAMKKRSPDKPLLVLVKNRAAVMNIVRSPRPQALKLMEAFWPGGLTLVFEAGDTLPRELTAGSGKIGVRIPRHPVTRKLLNAFDGVITGTSANISGLPGIHRIEELHPRIRQKSHLIIDAGELAGGKGSTIVDATTDSLRILRQGRIPAAAIQTVLGGSVLQQAGRC